MTPAKQAKRNARIAKEMGLRHYPDPRYSGVTWIDDDGDHMTDCKIGECLGEGEIPDEWWGAIVELWQSS